jgi:predicted lipoprotein with Yx(FWY)xxD motif
VKVRTTRWLLLGALAGALGLATAVAATGAIGTGHGTVQAKKTAAFGTVLFGTNGRVLYRFTHDRKGVNTCSSNAVCDKTWPALLVKAGSKPTAGPGVNAALLGTIPHGVGKAQVTYAGYPLYFFAEDRNGGDHGGEGLLGAWFVVTAKGALVKHAAATAPAATTTAPAPTTTAPAGGGGGGYGSGYGYGG